MNIEEVRKLPKGSFSIDRYGRTNSGWPFYTKKKGSHLNNNLEPFEKREYQNLGELKEVLLDVSGEDLYIIGNPENGYSLSLEHIPRHSYVPVAKINFSQ